MSIILGIKFEIRQSIECPGKNGVKKEIGYINNFGCKFIQKKKFLSIFKLVSTPSNLSAVLFTIIEPKSEFICFGSIGYRVIPLVG